VPNADSAMQFGRTADGIERFEFVQERFAFGRKARRNINRRQAGLQVAQILRVDFAGRTVGVEAEETRREGFGGEPAEAMGREVTSRFGQEKAQRSLAGHAAVQLQVMMPEQSEGQKRRFVFGMRTGHGGESVSPAGNFGAREDRRKRMLEIEGGGERFDFPAWELAREHAPELLGEVLALAHAGAVNRLGTVEIEERETAGLTPEFLNRAIEHAGRMAFDGENAARDAARFIPDFDGQPARANFEGVATVDERDRIFAVFQRGRTAAGVDKRLNRGEEEFGILRSCGIQLM